MGLILDFESEEDEPIERKKKSTPLGHDLYEDDARQNRKEDVVVILAFGAFYRKWNGNLGMCEMHRKRNKSDREVHIMS